MSYVDGYVLAIKTDRLDEYKELATKAGKIWIEHGALEYKECVSEDDNSHGFGMTFTESFKAQADETIIFAYVVYKSREHRDEVNAKVMADKRLEECGNSDSMPFEPKRMSYGGFKTLVSY